MNHPRALVHKVREELEQNPFPATINRLTAKRAEQLETHKTYAELLQTADSLPNVLEARNAELRRRIDHEAAVHGELLALIDRTRHSNTATLHGLRAECDGARLRLDEQRQAAWEKWHEVEAADRDLAELRAHGGLNAAQRHGQAVLDMLRQLPIRMGSRAAQDVSMSVDERWARLRELVDHHEQPQPPIYELFPSVKQFLTAPAAIAE